jgi:hypothetical protein
MTRTHHLDETYLPAVGDEWFTQETYLPTIGLGSPEPAAALTRRLADEARELLPAA